MSGAVGQATPFSDASDYNALEFQVQRILDDVQTMSVVEVLAVNSSAQTVDVVVLVNLLTGAGISVPHGRLGGRPYYRLQGGTSGIICDPAVGDIGPMVFASRDLSAVISSKAAANPASGRRFSWSDGVYMGGILNTPPAQYLQFASGGITLLSPTSINIQSPANTVTGPLTVTGDVILDQTLNVTGLTTTAAIVATAVTTAALTVSSGGTVSFPSGSLPGTVLTPSGVTAGSYTSANITVNAEGLITAAANGSGGGGSGTVTSVSAGSSDIVIGGVPTVTPSVDLSTAVKAALALAVTALQPVTGLSGSYTNVSLTLNAAGQITAISSGSGSGVTSLTEAAGIVLTPNPITGTGTVGFDTTWSPTMTGNWTFTPGSGIAAIYNGVAGSYAASYEGSTTSGQSFGFSMNAGTVSTDVAMNVTNAAGTTRYYRLWGDGSVSVGPNTTTAKGPGTVNASVGYYVANSATPIQFIESAGWNATGAPITLSLTVPQDVILPYGCTLQQVYITTQGAAGATGVSGSCVVTIGQAAFPGASFTDITGGSPPTISAGSSYSNATLTGWTISFVQGTQLRLTLTSTSNFYSVKIHLRFK